MKLHCLRLMLCIAVVLTWTSASQGNPIVVTSQPSYIAAEQLQVTFEETAALVDGRFQFRLPKYSGEMGAAAARFYEGMDTEMYVTLWVPDSSRSGDGTVRTFYDTIARDPEAAEAATKSTLEQAFAFRCEARGQRYPVHQMRLSEPPSWKRRKAQESDWFHRPGYRYVMFIVKLPLRLLTTHAEIRLSYRQPLRLSRSGAEFCYIPIFADLPAGQHTNDLAQYSMRLQAPSERGISLGRVQVAAGAAAVLPLSNRVPILAVME